MEKFGYIVADRKITNIKGFVGFANDLSTVDSTKPVLVVGIKKAKEILGDKFNILDKRISDSVYWTFSKTEKRSDFEDDILKFYQSCINNIINSTKYYYINIFKLKYSKIKKLYSILFSKEKKYIYINSNMLYFYYNGNVFGLSLRILNYCGINANKVIGRIKSNAENVIYDETSAFAMRAMRELDGKEYVFPYLIKMWKDK